MILGGIIVPAIGWLVIQTYASVNNNFGEIRAEMKEHNDKIEGKFDGIAKQINDLNTQLFAIKLIQQALDTANLRIDAQGRRIDKYDVDLDDLKKRVWSIHPSTYSAPAPPAASLSVPEQRARQKWETP